jgi:hypothetical protein
MVSRSVESVVVVVVIMIMMMYDCIFEIVTYTISLLIILSIMEVILWMYC